MSNFRPTLCNSDSFQSCIITLFFLLVVGFLVAVVGVFFSIGVLAVVGLGGISTAMLLSKSLMLLTTWSGFSFRILEASIEYNTGRSAL